MTNLKEILAEWEKILNKYETLSGDIDDDNSYLIELIEIIRPLLEQSISKAESRIKEKIEGLDTWSGYSNGVCIKDPSGDMIKLSEILKQLQIKDEA